MRQRKLAAMFAIGVAGVLLAAPGQAGARPDAPAKVVDRAHAKNVDVVPLVAVEQINRTVLGDDGAPRTTQETNRFYRDSRGRTRHESGSTVTISDPASGTTVSLDTADRTYTRSVTPARPDGNDAAPDLPAQDKPTQDGQLDSTSRSLGTAVVDGVRASGTEYALTLERDGKSPLTKDVTVWMAEDLQLDLSMRIVEPTGEVYSKRYTDVRSGVEPAAELFTVPGGYRPADRTKAAAAATDCPLDISPDPLILTSIGLIYFDSRPQTGSTDFANAGCLIVDSIAVTQLPLEARPNTPTLGLPFFEWQFYDNTDPFVPCNSVWFGTAGFLAYSTEDTTEKFSVVALYVYC